MSVHSVTVDPKVRARAEVIQDYYQSEEEANDAWRRAVVGLSPKQLKQFSREILRRARDGRLSTNTLAVFKGRERKAIFNALQSFQKEANDLGVAPREADPTEAPTILMPGMKVNIDDGRRRATFGSREADELDRPVSSRAEKLFTERGELMRQVDEIDEKMGRVSAVIPEDYVPKLGKVRSSEGSVLTVDDPSTRLELNIPIEAEDVDELFRWLRLPFRLERPSCSVLHRLLSWLRENVTPKRTFTSYANAHVFVVEHDWRAALKSAVEQGDEWRPPGPRCVFEFRVNGKPVLIGAFDPEQTTSGKTFDLALVEFKKDCWVPLERTDGGRGDLDDLGPRWWEIEREARGLVANLHDQIRAASIALEAEIAETEVERAPYKMNRLREKRGKLPLFDYHVVKLADRRRVSALPAELRDGEKRRSPRLHFRRGHWVHFPNHKTWRKWTLVGDPELGFVDKDYRL
jgi:hypothetical protein